MRVFFTTPFDATKKYQSYVGAILEVLHANDAAVISPEERQQYTSLLEVYEAEGLKPERAHYAFISQGIADADIAIIEATNEDIRVGHEVTLALLYGKPTLVVSQRVDFSRFIPHELLFGAQYQTKGELRNLIQNFLKDADRYLQQVGNTTQSLENGADSLHSAALAAIRRNALQDTSEFGAWARLSEKEPEAAYRAIMSDLGNLPVGPPWSAFAPVYNEDSPDYIQTGVAKFAGTVLRRHGIKKDDFVVEAATGTGALLRVMAGLGYRNLAGFDNSRPMLAEAFRLTAHLPGIRLFEADIASVQLAHLAKAVIWTDYSSNFALTPSAFRQMLGQLVCNLDTGGCLLFDVRTFAGWHVSFYRHKVTTFASSNFQRIWINLPDYKKHLITFDVFIRQKQPDGTWSSWRREQMTERMWKLGEVQRIVSDVPGVRLGEIYGDDFAPITETNHEPGLAYFILYKQKGRA